MKSKIKLIIFDGYGVVLSRGYPDTVDTLAKMNTGISRKRLFEILYLDHFNSAAEHKISQKRAWQLSAKEFKIMNWYGLRDLHLGLISINRPVFQLAKRLRKKYATLMLSKNTRSQMVACKKRFPHVWQSFDLVLNTWEFKLTKTSPETFRIICKKFKVKPTEIVFIDDQKVNLLQAKKLGIKTIYYRNFKQFKKELGTFVDLK